DLDAGVRGSGAGATHLPAVRVQLPGGQAHGDLLAVRRPEGAVRGGEIDFFHDLPGVLAIDVHGPDAVARFGRLAQEQDLLAVGREAGVDVQPAFGEPPLLGAVRLHQVELVAVAVGRMRSEEHTSELQSPDHLV